MARHTCEARIYPTGSIAYIPWLCHGEGEPCALPAVDYREYEGRWIWYCAMHWDRVEMYRLANADDYEEVDSD